MIRFILPIAVLVRVIFYSGVYSAPAWNIHMAFRFDERALGLARGEAFPNLTAWGAYPLFLSLLYKLLDLVGLLEWRLHAVFWLHQILGLLCGLLVIFILRHLKVKEHWAWIITSILIFLNPLQIYINSMNISESLFQLAALLMLALYIGCFKMNPWMRWPLFMICAVTSILTRNIVLPFLILLPIFIVLFDRPMWKQLLSKAFVASLLAAILGFQGVKVLIAKYDKGQQSEVNSNRGANIAQTWCEAQTLDYKNDKNAFWFRPPAFWPLEETRSLYLKESFGNTGYYTRLGVDCLMDDPSIAIIRTRSILNIFTGPLYPDPLKGALKDLNEYYGVMYLFFTLVVLANFALIWKQPQLRVFLLFVFACCAAVYAANTGESRFVYSFLPALVVLSGAALNGVKDRRQQGIVLVCLLLAGSAFFIPSLSSLMSNRDKNRYFQLSEVQKAALIRSRVEALPAVRPEIEICKNEFPLMRTCLNGVCNQEAQQRVRAEILDSQKTAVSEERFFCRVLLLSKLHQQKGLPLSLELIQQPSPLPKGPEDKEHPLVAIAGQLLQVDLLQRIQRDDLVPKGEDKDILIYSLLKFQYRLDRNRPEYRGAVTLQLKDAKPSEQAASIFAETLIQTAPP